MTTIHLVGETGEPLGRLESSADGVIAESEQHARDHGLTKRKALPKVLRMHIEAAGFSVSDGDLEEGTAGLEMIRRGKPARPLRVRVAPAAPALGESAKGRSLPMPTTRTGTQASRFFEAERTYPDPAAREWYDRLVGLDEHKRQLLLELELLLYPNRLATWSKKHHRAELLAYKIMAGRSPLILLEGDVGCGKTALAETVGDALAQRASGRVHLLKVNTQVRGTGMVGEMTDLIVQTFTQAEARADALPDDPVLLLIDEADALAARRVDQHMHHEDKAGLNTLLQRIDGLRLGGRRMAVMFITNRPEALDPAVRRRSALRLSFARPSDVARAELFRTSLPELDLTERQVKDLVALTGRDAAKKHGAIFTASDITDRLVPAAVRDAYAANRPLSADDLIGHAKVIEPTPLMYGKESDEG